MKLKLKQFIILELVIISIFCISCSKNKELTEPDIGKTIDISDISSKEEIPQKENVQPQAEKNNNQASAKENIKEGKNKQKNIQKNTNKKSKKTYGNKDYGYLKLYDDFTENEVVEDGIDTLQLVSSDGITIVTVKKLPKNEKMNDPYLFASNFVTVMASEDSSNIQSSKIKFKHFNPVYEIYKYTQDGTFNYFLWFMGNNKDKFVHMVTLQSSSQDIADISKMIQSSYKLSK